jgi:hypothetical protein
MSEIMTPINSNHFDAIIADESLIILAIAIKLCPPGDRKKAEAERTTTEFITDGPTSGMRALGRDNEPDSNFLCLFKIRVESSP